MCYLKAGGSSLERICPVVRRDAWPEHDDGVVLSVMSDPPMPDRAVVKSISLDGARAIDSDTHDEFRVLASPRHYHARVPRTL